VEFRNRPELTPDLARLASPLGVRLAAFPIPRETFVVTGRRLLSDCIWSPQLFPAAWAKDDNGEEQLLLAISNL